MWYRNVKYFSLKDEDECGHELAWNSLCAACGKYVGAAKQAEVSEVCPHTEPARYITGNYIPPTQRDYFRCCG
jgi:hypothetical protein